MKNPLLLVLILFVISDSICQGQAPILIGMTYGGGVYNKGTILRFNVSSENDSLLYSFGSGSTGYYPSGALLQALNGLLYGMNYKSGRYNGGTIFSYNIFTGRDTELYEFGNDTDGKYPIGSLMKASNGLLYGMTNQGGANGYGTIFNYDISTGKETVLHNFGNGTGRYPVGTLIQANNGQLYGITSRGGVSNRGIIFSYDISTGKETDLHSFGNGTDGIFPLCQLIQAHNGLLYGTTSAGGLYDKGIIFSYNISKHIEMDAYDFDSSYTDGHFPLGSLIQASDSLLYGMTSMGGVNNSGIIFSYNISKNIEINLHNFGTENDGEIPTGSFIQANNGLLYGTTEFGGSNDSGAIFSYNISADTEVVKYSFSGSTDGRSPNGFLMQAVNNTLYGFTEAGGAVDEGIIYNYDISDSTESDVHDFGNSDDGQYPFGTLVQAGNGLFYGMTSQEFGPSITNNDGVIFSYDIATGVENVLHDFNGNSGGSYPWGSLVQASNGLLYGMARAGGVNNNGIILSYDISTGSYSEVYNFDGINGGQPLGTLIQANNGLLYGMTNGGGAYNKGVIFSYNISTGMEINLHDFGNDNDGTYPQGALKQANNGLLYGMTAAGGKYNLGIIFNYDISTGKETNLYDFGSGTDGNSPQRGSLIQTSDNLLYGMTYYGGANNYGTIFSYDIERGIENVAHNFGGGKDIQGPFGSLFQASDGLLYGMTCGGIPTFQGGIFTFDISTGAEDVLHYFILHDTTAGFFTSGDFIEIGDTVTSINHPTYTNCSIQLYPNPSSTIIHLRLTLQQEYPVVLSLYNTLGQQVWVEDFGKTKQVETTIPISNLPNGVYILKVNSGNESQQKEVVVEK